MKRNLEQIAKTTIIEHAYIRNRPQQKGLVNKPDKMFNRVLGQLSGSRPLGQGMGLAVWSCGVTLWWLWWHQTHVLPTV